MKYKTILFDFDGTIADTEKILHDVMNALADEFGFAPVGEHEIPALRTMSARELLTKRIGIPLWNIPKARRLERRAREEFRFRVERIKLFPGMDAVLRDLRTSGIVLGVISSNEAAVVERVLEHDNVGVDFVHAGFAVLGKARQMRKALRRYGIDPKSALYVGDELRDVKASHAVGIPMIGVGWGLNSPEALRGAGVEVAASPQELLQKITQT